MLKFWRPRPKTEEIPCPDNAQLRRWAIVAATAVDPKRRLFDSIDGACRFSPPRRLVDEEFHSIWRYLKAEHATGRVDAEDVGKSERQLKNEYRAIAERRVRLGLVLAKIGTANGIDASLRGAAYENEVVDLIFGMVAADSA